MKNFVAVISVLLMLSSCQNKGDKFLGVWKVKTMPPYVMEITREGDYYLVNISGRGKITAQLDKNGLNTNSVMGVIVLSEDGKRLYSDGLEYFKESVEKNGNTNAAAWEPLTNDKEYKAAEPKVKECVAYLLGHPFSKDDAKSVSASKLLLKWMAGTPDYSFNMLGNITTIDPDGKSNIFAAYLAALVKEGFENPGFETPSKLKDLKTGEIGAMKIVAEYCANPSNKVKQTDEIKKLIKANKEGKLASILSFDAK
jgi:hypothetical protein